MSELEPEPGLPGVGSFKVVSMRVHCSPSAPHFPMTKNKFININSKRASVANTPV